ncbi:MAG: hypothetical protein PHE30_00810 [Candidatus Omnitrophica bacterium]|nr:hypothetical protein [Candidatus Omnitrophota bacterium]MDD5026877.1 hypothetical protein [Candidatus Omnitrophota bacterium]MDD5662521.1 hypothetical protein [Candidatus Omnitrophota bacterium]
MKGQRRWLLFFIFYFLLFTLCGCEAFVRKFTRKSKKDKAPVEMVLAPEEWKGPQMTKEEQYRQYFVFWQSWQDELINALTQNAPQKKKLDCAQQAMKNLVGLRSLLNESKQKQLDIYLKQLVDLQNDIKSDIYGNANNFYRQNSEKLKMNISQRFSYNDVKNDIL